MSGQLNGQPFTRRAIDALHVWPTPSALPTAIVADRGIDTNGNGLIDYVEFDVRVTAPVAGEYGGIANARLSETVVTRSSAEMRLDAGDVIIKFRVAAKDLVQVSHSGPITLSDVMVGMKGTPSDGYLKATYTTRPYSWQEFERPPVRILQYIGTRLVDRSNPPDGRFDALEVDLEIETLREGAHQYQITLAHDCVNVAKVTKPIVLEPGVQRLVLDLDIADKIAAHAVPGTYELKSFSLWVPDAYTATSNSRV